jgi:hypothetical protein
MKRQGKEIEADETLGAGEVGGESWRAFLVRPAVGGKTELYSH